MPALYGSCAQGALGHAGFRLRVFDGPSTPWGDLKLETANGASRPLWPRTLQQMD
jgi:hypothetical protein